VVEQVGIARVAVIGAGPAGLLMGLARGGLQVQFGLSDGSWDMAAALHAYLDRLARSIYPTAPSRPQAAVIGRTPICGGQPLAGQGVRRQSLPVQTCAVGPRTPTGPVTA
jgi:hypothetical protein